MSVSASRTLVAADGDCWIWFTMIAKDNHGNAYSGATLELELSHQNTWVTVRAEDTYSSVTYSDMSGTGKLWASSGGGDPSIGFRAKATGGGLTVRSSYEYVVFSAGQWVATFGSTLHGSGSGSATFSNLGTASQTFWVCGTAVSGRLDRDGWNYLDLACAADANRQPQGSTAYSEVDGSGGAKFSSSVAWEPEGDESRYVAPPGFSFAEATSADCYAGHWGGGGYSTGWSGPGELAYASSSGDLGLVDDSWPIYVGSTATGGTQPVEPWVGVDAYVKAEAAPDQGEVVSASAGGRQDDLGCTTYHNPVLDGYPAP